MFSGQLVLSDMGRILLFFFFFTFCEDSPCLALCFFPSNSSLWKGSLFLFLPPVLTSPWPGVENSKLTGLRVPFVAIEILRSLGKRPQYSISLICPWVTFGYDFLLRLNSPNFLLPLMFPHPHAHSSPPRRLAAGSTEFNQQPRDFYEALVIEQSLRDEINLCL